MQLKEATLEQQVAAGPIKIDGRSDAFVEFMGLLDEFPFWFKVVTP